MWKLFFTVIAAVSLVGSAVLVGGFQDLDSNDGGALDALNFAVAKHNRGSNDLYLSQVAQVIRVQRQVGIRRIPSGESFVVSIKSDLVLEPSSYLQTSLLNRGGPFFILTP